MRVVAPAGAVAPGPLAAGVAWLAKRWSVEGQGACLAADGYLAGTDEMRRAALQEALDDPEAGAIFAVRGGFGTTRILDDLDLAGLARRPKWIVGSSDLTALLVTIWHELGLASIHGPMTARFDKTHPDDLAGLEGLLSGAAWTPPEGLSPVAPGTARGPLVGGNLTVLAHLAGTLPAGFARGAVLFLEDVNEQPYRLDRALTQLERAGLLHGVAGFVVGELTGSAPAEDGITAKQVVAAHLRPLGVPVAAGYPAAHGARNAPFVHGADTVLEVASGGAALFSP